MCLFILRRICFSIAICFSFCVHAQLAEIDVYDITGDSLYSIKRSSKPVVVLVFDQFDCPYVDAYAERLLALQKKYASNVQFVYVNSDNDNIKSKSFKALVADRIKQLPVNTPYLIDAYANYLYQTGVTKSPEVCVVYRKKVIYKGGVDDNPLSAKDVRNAYLNKCLEKILNQEIVGSVEQKTAGCMISKGD